MLQTDLRQVSRHLTNYFRRGTQKQSDGQQDKTVNNKIIQVVSEEGKSVLLNLNRCILNIKCDLVEQWVLVVCQYVSKQPQEEVEFCILETGEVKTRPTLPTSGSDWLLLACLRLLGVGMRNVIGQCWGKIVTVSQSDDQIGRGSTYDWLLLTYLRLLGLGMRSVIG